jgi:hypothetical protein
MKLIHFWKNYQTENYQQNNHPKLHQYLFPLIFYKISEILTKNTLLLRLVEGVIGSITNFTIETVG